ncbi:MAG: c-type cytochrome [Pedosphaera sp.]|nr:c-type cytochrome [Pedosphaera sp.]
MSHSFAIQHLRTGSITMLTIPFCRLDRRSLAAVSFVVARVLFANSGLAASAAMSDPALPKCPPDWRVEVVSEPPQLVHPSTVCVAPDGRVFVAQDPIDMGLPSNSASDSILCIHPDGKITKFADTLHAVFGLAYLDGKLYVHHTPDFSVFTDDNGVGKDRVDLFTTNPDPNNNGRGFNDHIPSNMRLGMDGCFYMSTGDKGIFGAVGRDGSRVDLEGGGIMRFRPNGTHLEIYSNGTRNHLDVAINAEDELFTYDNTDDGNGWWTRVTHMVEGGFYGYPYDYKPRRPYTLWMMADYRGGSPTGAIAYNEDALPEEYRGNLFLSEWGRQQLLRLRVSRDGASYNIDSRVQEDGRDFLTAGTKPFRPNGLVFSPDGMSLYVADWNYGGWKANVVAGRLLKLTYTGKSLAAPKPHWWQGAAMAQPFQAATDELIDGLKHPAQSVRMVAQRRLAERGQAVAPQLKALLVDANAPAHARWHAIWSLDALDGGLSARQEVLAVAASDKDRSVRAQAIRQLGTRQAKDAVKTLITALKDSDPLIRFLAATALGRSGDVSAVPALVQALDEKDVFARYAMFTALNRIGRADPGAWRAIGAGLGNGNAAVREGTRFAMRETFNDQNLAILAGFVASNTASPEFRASALPLLAELHHERTPWTGKWWGTQPVKGSPRPKTVEWAGTSVVKAAIRNRLTDSDLLVRRAAVEAVAIASDNGAAPTLREMFGRESDSEMKRALVRSLGELKDEGSGALLAGILADPLKNEDLLANAIIAGGKVADPLTTDALIRLTESSTEPETLVLVLSALGNAKSTTSASAVAKLLRHSDAKLRSSAGEALAAIGGRSALDSVLPLLDDPVPAAQKAAIITAGLLRDKKALPKLLALHGVDATRADALLALTRMPDFQALSVYLDGLADRDGALRDASRRAIESFRDRALSEIETRHREKAFTGRTLSELQRVYTQNQSARQGPLFEGEAKPSSLEEYAKFSESHPGNAGRGRQIYEAQTTACVTCHRIAGKGGEIGPDLTGIASKYNRTILTESVLYPSKQIFEGYRATVVSTKDGESYTGFIREEKPTELTLLDAAGQKQVIRKDQIARRAETNVSLMPEGLQAAMTLSEFADLVAYLESLKQ